MNHHCLYRRPTAVGKCPVKDKQFLFDMCIYFYKHASVFCDYYKY